MPNFFVKNKEKLTKSLFPSGAPTGELPRGDRHADNVTLFWPNGLNNLTDLGKLRMYKVGLETRRHYNHYIDYDSEHILALSSPLYRCRDSMHYILQGLFNIEWTKNEGRVLVSKMNSCANNNNSEFNQCSSSLLSSGGGSPDEWHKIKIDSQLLASLYDSFVEHCAYVKNNPSPIESDLMKNVFIKSLPGIGKLRATLTSNYGNFNTSLLGIFSTISVELNVIRTESTYNYTDHFNGWINQVIIAKPDYEITLFDLFEQLDIYAYRDRYSGLADRIRTGQIIASIVESQLVALGNDATNERMEEYKEKKIILYSTHDTVIQAVLHTLEVINIDSPFENRFSRWYKNQDSISGLLSGLKMPSFGMSMRFELWELESTVDDKNKFQFVQLSIYNEDDAKFRDIEYKIVDLGAACNRLFKRKYPKASSEQLSAFYKTSFQYDKKRSCPFDLFRDVTSDLLINDVELHELCDINKPKM